MRTVAPGGKVAIDSARCTGQGRCFSQSPDVFDSDDQGYGVVIVPIVAAGTELAEHAQRAVLNCPESAVRVES